MFALALRSPPCPLPRRRGRGPLRGAWALAAALAAFPAAAADHSAAQAQAHGGGNAAAAASAAERRLGSLVISDGRARATLPNQPAAGAYLAVRNEGIAADRLVSASSPMAGRVEIHSMVMVEDVMVMRPVAGGLAIPPGETLTLAPGGFHLMLLDLREPLIAGTEVPVTLTFEKAGNTTLRLPVRALADEGAHAGHGN